MGERHGALAIGSGLALGAYAAGVLAGGALAGPMPGGQPVWPRRTTITMAAELVVLAGFSAGWLAVGGHPSDGVRLTLLALTAAAMGMQSAAVRLLGQMSTTYLTSTLADDLRAGDRVAVVHEVEANFYCFWRDKMGQIESIFASYAV